MATFTLTHTNKNRILKSLPSFGVLSVTAGTFDSSQLIIEQRIMNRWIGMHGVSPITDTTDPFIFRVDGTKVRIRLSDTSPTTTVNVTYTTAVNDTGYSYQDSATGGGGGGSSVTLQSLGELPAQTLPSSNTIDITQGQVALGHLIANTALTLSGATAGQSGMILLGNGTGHDGAGYTVSFQVLDDTNHATANSHTVINGDLADFATVPSAGEYNFGTIAWLYDGNTYYLYVSEVKPYQDTLTLPV